MASAVLCPACQTRNRSAWEFCVRCGESLEGAKPAAPQAPNAVRAEAPEGGTPADLASFYLVLMFAILFGTVALACRNLASQPPPPPPSPGVYAFGGPPAPPPPASPLPSADSDAQKGQRLLSQGRAAEALPFLEKAAAADPSNADLRQLIGQALWQTGDRERALDRYSEAARLAPGRYRLSYGQTLDSIGRTAEATSEMEAVLAAQPGNTTAQEILARTYYGAGEYAKALPLLEALASRTHDLVVLQQLGYAADKAGDRDRAAAAYRVVLASDPTATVARSLLADSLASAGRKDDAVAVLQEGVQRSPNAPVFHQHLGILLEQLGRSAEAAAAYREYARLAPNAPDAADLAARADRLEARLRPSGS
ncbi:MAG TPA: tetratricopeptide repeat protein [Vicinamibacteria bacterium]|nr:tetratricopeptide repeat protein [Vicinamibacteria bacterium]